MNLPALVTAVVALACVAAGLFVVVGQPGYNTDTFRFGGALVAIIGVWLLSIAVSDTRQ